MRTLGGAPRFWWEPRGWQARLAAPAAALYGAAASRRLTHGVRAETGVPLLCVGNFTVGGAGKTPAALALAGFARDAGRRPGFLSRGHGGTARTPTLVDTVRHGSETVGDEPLLLAANAPTVVSRDRKAGAERLLAQADCDFIIMDDGFQSARLAVDHALLVVDGARGLGNGCVFPAGPLRAPLQDQLRHADCVLIVGDGAAGEAAARQTAAAGRPVHRGRIEPRNAEALLGSPLLAFAGIADPGKFYRSLAEIGADVRQTRDFADHHPFTTAGISAIEALADAQGLVPATTEKDAARLRATEAGRRLLARTRVLAVALAIDPDFGAQIVRQTLSAFEGRRYSIGPKTGIGFRKA